MKFCINKKCVSAGKMQPMDNFYKDPAQRDGKMVYCKDCRKEQALRAAKKKKDCYYDFFNTVIG